MSETWEQRVAVWVGIALTVVAALLYIEFHRHAGPLWRDEVNSVNVAAFATLRQVSAHSYLDSFPVAWVLLLHAWIAAGLGGSDQALRGLGLAVGLTTLAVWWWTSRRLGLRAPLVTLVLLGMTPTMVLYGTEVRGYGLGVLGVSWCFGALFAFADRPSWWRYLIAQTASVLAVQAYFGNCFLLAALCAGGVAVGARRRAGGAAAAIVGVGVVAAASMAINTASIAYAARLAPIEQGDFGLRWFAGMFWDALAPDLVWLHAAWLLGIAAGVLGWAITVWAPRSLAGGADGDRAAFVGVATASALVAYGGYLTYISVRTQIWYYLPLMAVVALACDVGADLLASRIRCGTAVRLAAVVLAAVLTLGGAVTSARLRMTNVDVVAEQLAREARPGDLVVVFPWYCGITFARYYRGAAPWITLPDFDAHLFHLHAVVADKMQRREAAVAPELARVERTLRDGGRVWVAGPLVAPAPGQATPSLPAPDAPQRSAAYLDNWEQQLGGLLRTHARDVWSVPLPDVGPVNTWERLPLIVAEGWR